MRTVTRAAPSADLGNSSDCAFFFNPFMDLEVTYIAGMPCLVLALDHPPADAGLVATSDTHRDSEREMSCVTKVLTGATKCL